MLKKETGKKTCLPKSWDREADVAVIGYGGAGAVTAITAFDADAEVIILEKTPSLASIGIKPGRSHTTQISGGGNTHIAMGMASSPSNVTDAADYLFSACGGQTPMDVCVAWAEEVCKNEAWFKEMGIRGFIVEDAPREYPFIAEFADHECLPHNRLGTSIFCKA